LNKPLGDTSFPEVIKESYRHDSIKSPSHVKQKQGNNSIVSLLCSMNLLNKHIKCSIRLPAKTGSHVLRWQQAMLLREASDPASNDSF
jgi:hypothetical protein